MPAGHQGQTPLEKDLYFYHPDHLGSSSYITDTQGKLYEHLEYFPFGETWVEESSNTQRTPYLFTSKELDEETGLYYFGARYYDPRTSVWQSGDPILGKYLEGNPNNGVFGSINLALYTYGSGNPIRYFDPDGNASWDSFLKGVRDGMAGYVAADVGHPDQPQYASRIPAEDADSYRFGYMLGFESTRAADDYQQNPVRGSRTPGKMHIAQPPSTVKPPSNVQANKAKGDAFERQIAKKIKERETTSESGEQVTIKTKSGVKTRIDIISRDIEGNVGCTECKSSGTAPLTKNQEAAFPEIAESGGTIVGKGKPGFPGGTTIPPTKVEIVRPQGSE